ncbi:hypothetical protein [Alkalibacterium indicireducens]|uniref:Glycosyl hydrolase family 32 n=1 Tax=Alkalibacterium indicireducens TaxID=398758 RepID=A0ABN1ACT3_9LACT
MKKLYNNIKLPEEWPPKYEEQNLDEPLKVPYLENKQEIINIDTGRQLFVDDFLIEDTNLKRSFPKPEVSKESIFKPETPLELNGGYNPCATPFNDGIFFDEEENKFKMWYHAGWFNGVGYAESKDGENWVRLQELYPERESESVLNIKPNQIRDGAAVWIDKETNNKDERYKMLIFFREYDFEIHYYHQKPKHAHDDPHSVPPKERTVLFKSGNGLDWTEMSEVGPSGDNTGFFYNPFRKKWVFSLRTFSQLDRRVRTRGYIETDNFFDKSIWGKDNISFWSRSDIFDAPDEDLGYYTQLYDLNAIAYESLMIGTFSIFMGPPNNIAGKRKMPKICDLKLGFSRDGFHWERPDYSNFISSSREKGTWNYGYAHPVNGGYVVLKDEIYIYFSMFSGQSPKFDTHKYAGGNLGLAKLRRDGFAYMTDVENSGNLLTNTIEFSGNHLFVNTNCLKGKLYAEILDENYNVIDGFSADESIAIKNQDNTKTQLTWQIESIGKLKNRPVKIRFYLENAELYSFWVAKESDGKSNGFLGAGGPGFTEGRDC